MTIGWVTEATADTYFTTRLNSASWWLTGTAKEAALTTAYNDLNDCGLFVFPSTATDAMKRMQYEQALFILVATRAAEKRLAIQAHGVKSAGVVKETYGDMLPGIPIAPRAKAIGKQFYDRKSAMHVGEFTRDEGQDITS